MPQRRLVRFDDSLSTVLAADSAQGFGAQATWRQLVDLIGRRRVPGDTQSIDRLRALRSSVPDSVRAASARALAFATPPARLVALFAEDDLGIAAPVLRTANLPVADWVALMPRLTPPQRAVLRHRRDLDAEVKRALNSFGSVDFVLGDDSSDYESSATLTPETLADAAEPRVARRVVAAAPDHARIEIADLVARLDAFREKPPAPIAPEAPLHRFLFATDAAGVISMADGVARGALVGRALDPEPFSTGRAQRPLQSLSLIIGGDSDAAGHWLLAGRPAFQGADGAFLGYRGSARRHAVSPASAMEPVRQLVHELRTPANAIGGFSELIETELLGPIAPVYRERAGIIREQATMLTDAIDDLDTAARLESKALDLRLAPLALGPLLEQVEDKGVGRGSSAAGMPMLFADDRAAGQLLSRLASALVALAEPGEAIAVDVEAGWWGFVDLTFTRPRALAFGPLGNEAPAANSQPGAPLLGTGFALRLTTNLAQALGGSLTIDADCLTLRLPAAEEEGVEVAH